MDHVIQGGAPVLNAGKTRVTLTSDERTMADAALTHIAAAVTQAVSEGKRIVFWLMAAPSAFAWYEAFALRCRSDAAWSAIARNAHYFQFDDYPIARGDARFPVTFRHLLESAFISRVESVCGALPNVHLLELTGDAVGDAATMEQYRIALCAHLEDPGTFVVEVKGIGMDGHWGFHGRETPLDAAPEFTRVPMNAENRRQQCIDWPRYFGHVDDVPDYAVTATVALFMQADLIVDVVPQHTKEFAVLACYGTDHTVPQIPSSALKRHPNSYSFVTEAAGRALIEYRASAVPRLSAVTLERLEALWGADAERSRAWMRAVLRSAGIVS